MSKKRIFNIILFLSSLSILIGFRVDNAFALDQGATQDFVGSSPIKSMSGTSDKAYTYLSDGVNRVNIYSSNGYNDSRIYNVNLQLENSINMSNGNIIMLNYMIKTTDEYTAYRTGSNTAPICPSRRATTKFNIIDCEIVEGNSESLNDNGSETNNHRINGVYYVMLTIRYASSSTDNVSTIYLGGDFLAPSYYNVTNTVYFSNVQVYTAWTYKNFIDSIGIYMNELKDAISGIDLSQLEQYQRTMINQQSLTNQKIDEVNSTLEQQKEQDKDQYEQEKQEQAQREEQGKADAQQSSGVFNFQIINPLEAFFNLFINDQCTTIPTIAGMINSPISTYCSWFPSSIRSVMTPAFGLGSSMLLFGFIVRWLKGSGFNDSIELQEGAS